MIELKWTKDQEQHLRDQVITADQPGPVLKDFRLILDYLGTEGVKSAGKYNLLPLSCIPELDPHLSRPLSLDLNRPQLRTHPYLQGLNLLLRASGLGRVEGVGAKARLALDPVMLEQWNRLNPTEQYFNLLEAWWLYGRAEMVGDKGRRFGTMLRSCLHTIRFLEIVRALPKNAPDRNAARSPAVYLAGIGGGLLQLALLDLFGIVAIEQPPPGATTWIPVNVVPTPFGHALLALIDSKVNPYSGNLLEDEEIEDEEIEDEEIEDEELYEPWFGVWQPRVQPYFPEWRENLEIPRREPRKGVHIFRVSLGTIWRLIAMPADASLDDLVGWILRSVNFDSDHLYSFTYRDDMGAKVNADGPVSNEGPRAGEIAIGRLPLKPKQTMDLLYDFGDRWRFTIKLERVESPDAKVKAPRIVEKHGKAPKQYGSWDD